MRLIPALSYVAGYLSCRVVHLADRLLATHLDSRLCEWSNVTGGDE